MLEWAECKLLTDNDIRLQKSIHLLADGVARRQILFDLETLATSAIFHYAESLVALESQTQK